MAGQTPPTFQGCWALSRLCTWMWLAQSLAQRAGAQNLPASLPSPLKALPRQRFLKHSERWQQSISEPSAPTSKVISSMKRTFTHLGEKRSVSIFIILIVIFREVISKMHFNRSICPIITTKRMLFLCVIPVIGQPREDCIGLIRVQSLTLLQPPACWAVPLPFREEGDAYVTFS